MKIKDWLLLIIISLMWGSSFFFNAILVQSVGPWALTAGRVTIGAIGVWVYIILTGRKIPTDPALWRFYILLGSIAYALPFTAIAWGQLQISGGLASIINAMNPITILIITHFWPGGEKATRLKFTGVVIGFAGVALLMLPKLQAGAVGELLAYLAVYSATICYAIGLNIVRRLKHHSPVVTAAGALSGAALTSLLLAFIVEGVPGKLNQVEILSFLSIGLISTSLAFSIMYYLLPRIGAVNFSMVTFMVPITAIFLGISFLGESLEFTQIAGMAVIFLGLLFIDGRLFNQLTSRSTA
jgi:drug/metabolite transporter (DMT)-like permease